MSEQAQSEAKYREISPLVDQWLQIHQGETFQHEAVCKDLQAVSREARQLVSIKLNNEVKGGRLQKLNRYYRFIVSTFKELDWLNASDEPVLDISWPYGIEDNTHFGFDGTCQISPGDIIVNAGVTNTGKTTFALNFLWANMDRYPCILMGNEYTPAKFKQTANRMSQWISPIREDGKPKFRLVERHTAWQDIIEPDSINIVDWINLNDNFYQIGSIIEQIKTKLRNGICLITIQKDASKEFGTGAGFGTHLASLYITMDFNRLTVKKCKAHSGIDPNNKSYGFNIVNYGTRFHNIREIKPCPKCRGVYTKNLNCACNGTGWIDVEK